jgi:glutathione S-transferase
MSHPDFERAAHHITPEYLRLNPNGVVPTLVHDGVPIIESSVIAQYLDDMFPERSLSPRDPQTLAAMRAWLAFVDQVPTPAVRYPSFQYGGLIRKFQAMSPEEFDASIARRPLKSRFYRRMGQAGFPQEDIDDALDDMRKTVSRMESMLAAGGPWLMGEQYTLADICVAPLIDRIENLGYSGLWQDLPRVTDWLHRIKARPAYLSTFLRRRATFGSVPRHRLWSGVPNRRSHADLGAIEGPARQRLAA